MNPSDEITFFCPVSETDITQSVCNAIVQGIEHNDFACGEIPAQTEANQAQCQRCPRSPFVAHNNARIDEAIIFAVKRHAGGLRKGTTLPYILHPLEVLQILSNMNADTDLQIAGLLHDTIEDTDTTAQEIAALFGEDVAALVSHHSEDKEKSWLARKTAALAALQSADERQKMLALADKLSNLRSIAHDYAALGDALWQRFHAPKEKQAWYYNGILDALAELEQYEETAPAYQELLAHYKDVFVIYKISPTYDKLYQANTFGQAYCLTKGSPQWQPVNYRFRQNDIALTRQEAETLEDKWYDLFLAAVEQDLTDQVYPLSAKVQLELREGTLLFRSPELCAALDEENTYQFFTALRTIYGTHVPLAQLFRQVFGDGQNVSLFAEFCAQTGVHYTVLTASSTSF